MESLGLRGSASTRIDDKGRLKVPTLFRAPLVDKNGPDVFVTSVTGECVRIYPMALWVEIEAKLAAMPSAHPVRTRFLDRVNYFGQPGELDQQGRIVVPPRLRERASMAGEVRVFGRLNYLEVWNEERFVQRLELHPWTDEDGLLLSQYGI